MTDVPLFSTITLVTELLVTASVYYIFYSSYRLGSFPRRLAFLTLGYEVLFNISYMTYRAWYHDAKIPAHTHTPFHLWLAIFHGTFSFIMFIALVVFLIIASRKYKAGINYFKEHARVAAVFLVCWTISILSGVLFYYVIYFTKT